MSSFATSNANRTAPRKSRDFGGAGRAERALAEIEIALSTFDAHEATADQLADLADALDAFRERFYGVALALARASTRPRPRLGLHRRPESMARTLAETRTVFAELRAGTLGAPTLLRAGAGGGPEEAPA